MRRTTQIFWVWDPIPVSHLMKNSNANMLNGRPMKSDPEDTLAMRVEMSIFALGERNLHEGGPQSRF